LVVLTSMLGPPILSSFHTFSLCQQNLVDFNNASWEQLSIFLNFLIPKLPAPKQSDEDATRNLLETVNLDSYRNEIRARKQIKLEDAEGELKPIPMSTPSASKQTELDFLSNIVSTFNDIFGGALNDPEFAARVIAEEIPKQLKEDKRLNNAIKQGDKKKIAMEKERVMLDAMVSLQVIHANHIDDVAVLLKGFVDNEQQRRVLINMVDEYMKNPYPKAVMEHPGWDELFDLIDDERALELARGLKSHGVPAPLDVDVDIPGSNNERALMVWSFEDNRPLLGLVDHEIGGDPRDMTLVRLEDNTTAATLAPQLIALLEQDYHSAMQ